MGDRLIIKINPLESDEEKWPLGEFIKLAQDIYDGIPTESKNNAFVEFDCGDGCFGYLRISYERLETDGEMAQREAEEYARRRASEKVERLEYERLKRKFE